MYEREEKSLIINYLKVTASRKVIAGVKLLIADPRVGEL